jgi:XTP/dITP diphosphohydrolase
VVVRKKTLLVATANPGKFREIVALLSDLPFELQSLSDFPKLPDVIEDGETFMANAEKKARHFAELTGMITLADDSGLEVDCLDGRPGIHSARFAGEAKDDRANNAKLIKMLEDVPLPKRTARFRCAVVIADANEIVASAEGKIEGLIIEEPRGTGGFGYDPHFLVPQLDRTTAELDPDHKNRISHRGQALRRLRTRLQSTML